MDFEIINGEPTQEEFDALQVAIIKHKGEDRLQETKRSIYGLPQLRQPLPHQTNFGAKRFS